MKAIIIAVTGGVGAGKTTVCKMIEEMGFKGINADKINHQLLAKKNIVQKIVEVFDKTVLDNNQNLNINSLSNLVFSNKENLSKLTNILYPEIKAELSKQIKLLLNSGNKQIIIEAPTLYEANCQDLADFTITVEADSDKKNERTHAQRNWEDGESNKREQFLIGSEQRAKMADAIIVNNSNKLSLENQVNEIIKTIVQNQRF